MMLGKMISNILAGCVALCLLVSVSYGFDKEANVDALNINHTSYDTYVKVKAFGTALALAPDPIHNRWIMTEGYYELEGSGYIPVRGSLITAAHVVHPDLVQVTLSSAKSFYTSVHKVLTNTILITNFGFQPVIGWIYHIDLEKDIAIIHYDSKHAVFSPGLPNFVGCDSDNMITGGDFEVGDAVAVVVRKRHNGVRTHEVEVRVGNIIKWGPTSPNEDATAWLSPYDFTMDAYIMPGDSGSPVFVFKNGVPIFVGVARALYTDGIVWLTYAAFFGMECRHFMQ